MNGGDRKHDLNANPNVSALTVVSPLLVAIALVSSKRRYAFKSEQVGLTTPGKDTKSNVSSTQDRHQVFRIKSTRVTIIFSEKMWWSFRMNKTSLRPLITGNLLKPKNKIISIEFLRKCTRKSEWDRRGYRQGRWRNERSHCDFLRSGPC
ncbi:hypothetical protein VNO80_26448 [Phaseolus coccineus]|uniref:Uncharacterized protein n=1 Tax=Phaseolus coccineus TaxID=3886 RepID=A0AAN9LI06_PHACN